MGPPSGARMWVDSDPGKRQDIETNHTYILFVLTNWFGSFRVVCRAGGFGPRKIPSEPTKLGLSLQPIRHTLPLPNS